MHKMRVRGMRCISKLFCNDLHTNKVTQKIIEMLKNGSQNSTSMNEGTTSTISPMEIRLAMKKAAFEELTVKFSAVGCPRLAQNVEVFS